jgi:hypothetical protein
MQVTFHNNHNSHVIKQYPSTILKIHPCKRAFLVYKTILSNVYTHTSTLRISTTAAHNFLYW